jgi:hypothetical protein
MYASWLMEAGIHRTKLEDIYPDAMVDALRFLPYHTSYTTLFAAMKANGLDPTALMLAVKGDSQLINTVEARLFANGVIGSNGVNGTVAPWTKMLHWMVVGEYNWRVDKKWQRTITRKVEEKVKAQYCRSGADVEEMAQEGWGWITEVWEPNSDELVGTLFFGNTGPRWDQRIKVFNVQHLSSLYDVLAEGAATHARAHTCTCACNTTPLKRRACCHQR